MTLSGAVLRVVRMGGVTMGGGVMMGGGYDMGGGGADTGIGFLDNSINWVLSQPDWLSAIIFTAAIVLVGFILGKIIGKVYISIRYPSPDKPQYLSPKQKIIVLAAGTLILALLMGSFMKKDDADMLVDGDMNPGIVDGPGGIEETEGSEGEESEGEESEGEDAPDIGEGSGAEQPDITPAPDAGGPAVGGPAISPMPAKLA